MSIAGLAWHFFDKSPSSSVPQRITENDVFHYGSACFPTIIIRERGRRRPHHVYFLRLAAALLVAVGGDP
jgi:hypothetical protein